MQSMRGVNGSVSGVDIYILIFFKFGGLIYKEERGGEGRGYPHPLAHSQSNPTIQLSIYPMKTLA